MRAKYVAMTMKIWILVVVSAGLLAAPLYAQEGKGKDKAAWDVSAPYDSADFKEVSFSTDEGTWMNLDVSPDGKEIVFDLLGDIYLMPIGGGAATLLRGGAPYEVQPRFSPDGSKISFTSDAGGGDNIWIMNRNGEKAKQITKENFRLLNNGVWMPNGKYLIARKHFTSRRSLGAGEMWMYHIGGGDGLQLTKRKNDQQDAGEPVVSADGRYLYFSEEVYPGGYFQYNKDPNNQIYVIRRYDFEKGELKTVVQGPGGAVRPQVSHSGKLLTFVRRVRDKSVLFATDLTTGEEWPVYDGLTKDQQEAWCVFGVYPNYAFTPDDKYVILWAQGKLHKVEIATGKSDVIPFKVTASHRIMNAIHFEQPDIAPAQFDVKVIRQPVTSPDGKWLVFNAVGYLWKKQLPNGKPERLTKETDFEFEPSFSTDGNTLCYVTWNDEQMGSIMSISLKGGQPKKLTTEKAIYRTPAYSPDGSKLVYWKEEGNEHQGFAFCINPGLYTMPAGGGTATQIAEEGSYPRFSPDGSRIYYQIDNNYYTIKADGTDKKTLFTSTYVTQFVPSNDGNWVAFQDLYKLYITPFPHHGKAIDLSGKMSDIPLRLVAKDAGYNIHWSNNDTQLHWTLGDNYYTTPIQDNFTFVVGAPDSLPAPVEKGIPIGLQVTTDIPQGKIAFTNVNIITVNKTDEVISNGQILIENNKIKALGTNIAIPPDAKIMDMKGMTVMPGFVDVHAHQGTFRFGLMPQKHWPYYASLAFGITTTHDPSSDSEMIFGQSELVKAGKMVGPRIFSTGTILYGADGDFKAVINSLDDAQFAIRRTKAWGAFSVKSYNQPRREQRQQVLKAAKEEHIQVVPEGGSFFFHNMTMILDGHTGIEHNIPIAPLYNDVVQLWSASNTGYTPTLIVAYGSLNGENYWYQKTNVWENKRLLTFTPRAVVDPRSRHRTMSPDEEFSIGHILISQSVKKLADAGVKVNLGSHGQMQGIGAHWELWMLAQGGMSPAQVIRCATMNGATYIGMDKQIGSIEPNKLADLIFLTDNPLTDIHNTESIRYTMINGRLYDCDTMNEIGNTPHTRTSFYWELNKASNAFPFHERTNSFCTEQCGCRH